MRAWVLEEYGRLALREGKDPEGEGVLVRVVASGLCGSDLSVYKGTPAMRARWKPPLVLGHEVAGVVEEGPEALLGRVVALYPALACGRCAQCEKGRPHLCPERRHLGFHFPGGLAERIRVPPSLVHPLPGGLPAWKGALAEPLGVVLHALRRAAPVFGEAALVLGGGAMGALAAWLLGRAGCTVHLVEPQPSRARRLMKLGLAARVVPRLEDLLPARFDLVLDTVGGPGTLAQALEGLASGGRAVVVGLSGLESPLSLQDLVLGEKALLGSYLFTPQEFQEALDLLPHLPEALVQRWPAAQAPEAFQALLEGRVPEPKLVLVW